MPPSGSSEGNGDTWIPFPMIVGVSAVPPGAAVVIRQAVKQMIERGEVSPRAEWQALEFLASDYLAGP